MGHHHLGHTAFDELVAARPCESLYTVKAVNLYTSVLPQTQTAFKLHFSMPRESCFSMTRFWNFTQLVNSHGQVWRCFRCSFHQGRMLQRLRCPSLGPRGFPALIESDWQFL